MTERDLQAREKVEHPVEGESTRNVPIYSPAVDIYESANALVLVADMPGVGHENVSIDVSDNQLTLRGTVTLPADGRRCLLQEYGVGDYFRQFTLGKTVDQSKIEATMKEGVLTLTLPKADAIKPRKITVRTD